MMQEDLARKEEPPLIRANHPILERQFQVITVVPMREPDGSFREKSGSAFHGNWHSTEAARTRAH